MVYIHTDLPMKGPLKSKRDYDRERAAREKFTDGELLAMAASALSRLQFELKKAQVRAECFKNALKYQRAQEQIRESNFRQRFLLLLITSGLAVFAIVSVLLILAKVPL